MIMCALNHEKRLFTSDDFSPDRFFDLLDKYKFTHLTGTPAFFKLLHQSERFKTADFSSLKRFVIGGIHCPLEMRNAIKRKMPNTYLMIVYGMTEALTICVTEENDKLSLSVGKPFSDAKLKILLEDGSFGGLNEIGEILILKQKNMFLGYLKNPKLTAEALDVDGWMHTGDMGFIDEQLNLTIVGRKIFMIKSMSRDIFPTEIEEIIDKIDGVKASCVIGVPSDDPADELPTAFIIKDKSKEVSAEKIHEVIGHLGQLKQLRGGVLFVESFEVTCTGKVLRFQMKEKAIELRKK